MTSLGDVVVAHYRFNRQHGAQEMYMSPSSSKMLSVLNPRDLTIDRTQKTLEHACGYVDKNVQRGDTIAVFSKGVHNNVGSALLLTIISDAYVNPEHLAPEDVAKQIVGHANCNAHNYCQSHATDMTCVVAYVCKQ